MTAMIDQNTIKTHKFSDESNADTFTYHYVDCTTVLVFFRYGQSIQVLCLCFTHYHFYLSGQFLYLGDFRICKDWRI